MVAKERVADYISRRIGVGRVAPGLIWWSAGSFPGSYFSPLPTSQQLAEQLLADAEFSALRLGTLLSTPEGHFIQEAVGIAVPSTLAPEYQLIVDALQLAAAVQQGRLRRDAVAWTVIGALVGVLGRDLIRAA